LSDISAEKATARKAALTRRFQLNSSAASRAGAEKLLDFLIPYRGSAFCGYMPIRTEIDPLFAMSTMTQYGPVGVPVVLGEGQSLEFRRWNKNTPMMAGAFGAQVPIEAEIVIPDLIVLPLVAFDKKGYRLGYGGGFYDRTLESLRKRGPIVAVGFAYSGQQVDNLPVEPTDQKLDAVVTENDVTLF